MNIGIIGAGNVGGALGTRWAHNGHTIVFSARDPDTPEMRELVQNAGPHARAASVADAIAASDIVLVATPWPVTLDALKPHNFAGKILIDATNPLAGLTALTIGTTTSAAEQIAQAVPAARVVKAFNTVGANIMANPDFHGPKPVLFYCGDDQDAKQTVHSLAAELGFDARDAGPLTQARLLEPFALLWISLAFAAGYGRDFAFQVITREP